MEDLAKDLLMAVKINQANGSRLIRHAISLLHSGFLDYYARQVIKNRKFEDILARITKLMRKREFSENEIAYLLGWSFSQDRSFRAGIYTFPTPEAFREEMERMRKRNRTEYLNYIVSARQDLDFVSEFNPDRNAKYIKEVLKAGDDESSPQPLPPNENDPGHPSPGEARRFGGLQVSAVLSRGLHVLEVLAEGLADCIANLWELITEGLEGASEFARDSLRWYPVRFWSAVAAIVLVIVGVFWKICATGTELPPEQCLSRGFVLEQQNEKALALKYFEKACQGDIVNGCNKAGWYYQYGIGTPEADYGEARDFYELSCNLNDGMGCSGLGWLYQQGQGGSRDYDKAREYYQKGCQLDNGNSCTGLGNLYRYGLGVSNNPTAARNYFEKACHLGHHKGCTAIQE